MPSHLIVDGVTGAGKTQTIAALLARDAFRGAILVPEERTLGELMDEELADVEVPPAAKLWRLEQVLGEVRAAAEPARFVFERFHPTYYALMGDWPLVDAIDRELASRGFRLALLTVPPRELVARGLHRKDRAETSWTQEMVAAFGSEEAAIAALEASQARRIEALAKTALPTLRIDTTDMEWARYAEAIEAFAR